MIIQKPTKCIVPDGALSHGICRTWVVG